MEKKNKRKFTICKDTLRAILRKELINQGCIDETQDIVIEYGLNSQPPIGDIVKVYVKDKRKWS